MVAAAPLITMVASTAISAVSSIAAGQQQKAAYNLQRQQYEEQAQLARLGAAQEESARLADLDKMLATQRAMAVARGYDPETSASFEALQKDDTARAMADIDTAKINRLSGARAAEFGAAQAESSGNAAAFQGFAGAAGSLFRFASSYSQIGGAKGPAKS